MGYFKKTIWLLGICLCSIGLVFLNGESAKAASAWAGIMEDDAGRAAVVVTREDEVIAEFSRLLPDDIQTENVTVETTQEDGSLRVRVSIGDPADERLICLEMRDGTWTIDYASGEVDNQHVSICAWDNRYVINLAEKHPVYVSLDTFDLSENALSYADVIEQAAAIFREETAQREERVLSILAQRFPQERFDETRIAAWDIIENEKGLRALAAVERGEFVSVYLMDDWTTPTQNVEFERNVLFAPVEIDVSVQPDWQDEQKAAFSYRFRDGNQYGCYLTLGEHGAKVTSVYCSTEGEQWWNRFGEERMAIDPAERLATGMELYAPMDARFREIRTFCMDEVMAAMRLAYDDYLSGEAPYIPETTVEYGFPQPCDAVMKKGTYPVYSGPGKNYYREANSKAQVSANDWVQVFGREGKWVLIQYRVKENHLRFGYVYQDAFANFEEIPPLQFEATRIQTDNEFVTSDPLGKAERIELDAQETTMVRLAALGNFWIYVEIELPNGKLARMFAETLPSHG